MQEQGTTRHETRRPPQRRFNPSRWLKTPRDVSPRLPDDRQSRTAVDGVLDGVLERPGRPVNPDLARMIYAEVEYLTRDSGVLAVTAQVLAARVNLTVDRRNVARAPVPGVRPIPKATVGKVRAVLHQLAEAGWITPERKTMRAQVWVVSHGQPPVLHGHKRTPRTTVSTPSGVQSQSSLRNATRVGAHDLPDIEDDAFWTGAASTTPLPETDRAPAEQAARVLVDRYRDRLACHRSPNPAGAWYRWLLCRLRDLPARDLAAAVGRYDLAIQTLARQSRDGRVWLVGHRIEHASR